MKIPIALFLDWIIKQYNLTKHVLNGFIYLEMRRAVWGLPQAGILANKLLQKCLLPHGYYECTSMPGLWKHKMRPILFTLVVDNFGVKYVGKVHVDHLIWCFKQKYELTKDWTGDLYCGIKLNWDYDARTLIFQCRDTSKKFFKITNIACRQNCNIAHTHLRLNNTAQKHNPPSQLTSPPNHPQKKLRRSSESLAASCTMHALWTLQSSWR
jgi:hypothetical protein